MNTSVAAQKVHSKKSSLRTANSGRHQEGIQEKGNEEPPRKIAEKGQYLKETDGKLIVRSLELTEELLSKERKRKDSSWLHKIMQS